MKKPSGIVIYEGPSVLDGASIVAVATLSSKNEKTGAMVQTWILRTDLNPVAASAAVMDGSVCGACPHRHSLGGGCYVNIGQAPLAVWRAYKRGTYPRLDAENAKYLQGRAVRMGSYGDPAAVPAAVWGELAGYAAKVTGYTHQAAHRNFDPTILQWCMVSADTPKAAMKAQAQGRRTFRVKTPEAPMLPGEIECLSDAKGITCIECGLCNGASNAQAPSIVINVHGSRAKRYTDKFNRANLIAVSAA
jgi:hypothetical protein